MTEQAASDTGDQETDDDAQISQGPSSFRPAEPLGGADAVPETPDNVPADHIDKTDSIIRR